MGRKGELFRGPGRAPRTPGFSRRQDDPTLSLSSRPFPISGAPELQNDPAGACVCTACSGGVQLHSPQG